MHRPPHSLGLQRVVEVYSGHDDLVGATGSGYVIGPDLVLTSARDPESPCQVRSSRWPWWAEAEQVWRGRGSTDAALLRVPDAPWRNVPGIDHVRWAATRQAGLPCVAYGYALAHSRDDHPRAHPNGDHPTHPNGHRPMITATGHLDGIPGWGPPTATVTGWTVPPAVPSAVPPAEAPGGADVALPDWLGLSGAALVGAHGRQVLGVVRAGRSGHAHRRLDIVPVAALLADAGFRELAGVRPEQVEELTGEPGLLLPDLLLSALDELPPGSPDWALLAPRHAVVPFLGRTHELATLRSWAASPDRLSIAVLTGAGGTGKTRLAAELCDELGSIGWDTGFLRLPPLSGPAVPLDALGPTLLVVDLPEPSAALPGELIRRLAAHPHNPRVRVLLVARAHAGPDWWQRFDAAAGGLLKHLTRTAIHLDARPLSPVERTAHATAATHAFTLHSAQVSSPPAPRQDQPAPGRFFVVGDERPAHRHPQAREDEPDRPLQVHVAALMRVRGLAPEPGGDPVERLLEHEQARHGDPAWRQAAAVVTLTAPAPGERRALLSVVPGAAGFDDDGPASAVVAERLLGGVDELTDLVLALHDHPTRTAGHLARMLAVLRAACGDARVREALLALLTGRLDRMAVEAATGPGEQLGDLLDAAVRALRDEPALARAAMAVPPGPPGQLGLRALEATLAELRAESLRAGGDPAELAAALSDLSVRLAALGRLPEATAAAAEAVETFATTPPDTHPAAQALFNHAACLLLTTPPGETPSREPAPHGRARETATGHPPAAPRERPPHERAPEATDAPPPEPAARETVGAPTPVDVAREAAGRFRRLAEVEAGYAGQAAGAQYNLACALLGAGRLGEAVAAFAAAGGDVELAGAVGDVLLAGTGAGRAGDMTGGPMPMGPGMALDEGRLRELGTALAAAATRALPEAADEGVWRALRRVAGRLGKADGALVPAAEAVARLRGAAAREPGLGAELASAAGELAGLYADRGRYGEAAVSAAEAVACLRALVVTEPDGHRPELVRRLLDLGECLLGDGRAEEALEPLREAATGGGLSARGARLLGMCLLELGRNVDGTAYLERAAELYRERGERRVDVLAAVERGREAEAAPPPPALINLVSSVRPEEDVTKAERELADHRRGDGDVREHVAVQARLAWTWAATGRPADGVVLAEQAAELLDRYVPAEARTGLAGGVAAALGRSLVALGRDEEAVPHLTAAVAACGPEVRLELVERLVLAATALSRTRRDAEAEAAADRLVELLRAQVEQPSRESRQWGVPAGVGVAALAGALRLRGGIRLARGDLEGALEAAGAALAVLPPVGREVLAGTCLQLSGLCRSLLGDGERAAVELVRGTTLLSGLFDEQVPVAPEVAATHRLALLRLGGRYVDQGEPAEAAAFYGRALEGPAGGLEVLGELAGYLGVAFEAASRGGPGERARLAEAMAELLPPLTDHAAALERDVPVRAGAEAYELLGRCLETYAAVTEVVGDPETAADGAELAVRVLECLAACDPARYGAELGAALGRLGGLLHELGRPDLTVLARAADVPGGGRAAALYGIALLEAGRTAEAVALLERAADLCDEPDDPATSALTYAYLAAGLVALDRPGAALDAAGWSLAEQERVPPEQADRVAPLRAMAAGVRETVLRATDAQ
ncbi:hypothetical protein [Nonomuraea ceibae]|uniref:hypothetical protein n=1 Tax=Nonomuraea ceibae TaxID=1935170 RepID=UPI001C5E8CA9|nr:hypothetical protein [Nonomuraea ceibae]